jgi:predicted  nucleic acid-binding Zn-ribbon protein
MSSEEETLKKEKEAADRFKQNMGSFFHDLFRASGLTMTAMNATERVRATGERMASSIEAAATRKSIQVIRQLQTAVTDAFVLMENALKEVKTVCRAHSGLLVTHEEEITALNTRIDQLENALLSRATDKPE